MKKMTTKEQFEKIINGIDENKETCIVLHADADDNVGLHFVGSINTVTALIASVVSMGLKKHADEAEADLAKCFVDGVCEVMSIPNMQGIKVALRMAKALQDAVENQHQGISSVFDKLAALEKEADDLKDNDDDDDEGDDEDCSTCKANRLCPLPQAIKYRKENGIPAPPYVKKGRKNRKQNNEKGN